MGAGERAGGGGRLSPAFGWRPARRQSRLLLPLLAACATAPATGGDAGASAPAVVIDGAFDDWSGAPSVSHDGPAGAEPRVRRLRARHDASYLYLQLDLDRPVNLLGLPSPLTVAIDADGDARTGWTEAGLAGTDLALDFTRRDSTGRVLQGAAVRTLAGTLLPSAVELTALPGYATDRVELRVRRGMPVSGAGFRVRAAHGGDATPVLAVAGLAPAVPPALPAQPADPLRRAPGTALRVLQWNVSDRGLLERPDVFRRILDAADADVLLLDEVTDQLGPSGFEAFLRTLAGPPGAPPWRSTYGLGGGYQRSTISSRNGVTLVRELDGVAFPDTAVARLLALAPAPRRAIVRGNLDSLLSAGGALVEVNGRRLLAVALDLQSAGNDPASWQEQRRRLEARLVRNGIVTALRRVGRVDGVIVAGDLNLVGTRDPLDTLAGTPADRGRPLALARTLQLDGRTAATWDGGDEPFPPGRLDWLLYSGSTLRPLRAFSLDTRDLAPRWLDAHLLRAGDSQEASDHFPTIVDFAWVR